MKAIPLTEAILKQFIRDWKSVLLLIVLPLVLISIVFLSFNSDGLRKIPVGVVGSYSEFNIDELDDRYFTFLTITKFSQLEHCLSQIRIYRQYLCIEVKQGASIVLEVHYDNTREPVIWEVIERVKNSVEFIQKSKSKEIASDFLTKFDSALGKVGSFKSSLQTTNSRIDGYVSQTGSGISTLRRSKQDLRSTLDTMDNDIRDARSTKQNLKNQKDNMHSNALSYLSQLDNYANILSFGEGIDQFTLGSLRNQISNLRSTVNSYDSEADSYFREFDTRVNRYEDSSRRGREYITDIDDGIVTLSGVQRDLTSYSRDIDNAENEISQIQNDFQSIQGLDPETLVNPIRIQNIPTYIPRAGKNVIVQQADVQTVIRGINLISLQTLFPSMLLLITLFLALLISTFVSLGEINSSANTRVTMIKHIFFHQLLSVFASSHLIMFIPIFCVLLLGQILFQIPIIDHIFTIALLLFLLSSNFILIGISIACLIKKESVALLITSFVLVFFIFISGFILPIERMTNAIGLFASIFPAKLSLFAFNQIVFYDQTFHAISTSFIALSIWLFFFLLAAITIKKIRRA